MELQNKEVIKVKNLTKKFDDFTAVDDISLQVERGEIFAFLGPNGAGKSTSIKIMTTISKATSGEILINGFDVSKNQNEVRKSIGVIFQDNTLDEELTAYENLYYHAILYRVPKKEIKERIEGLLDYVGLLDRKDNFIKTFSGGMRRRTEIARGLLHSPEVLFLDEPTIGLDVQTRTFLWEHMKRINTDKGVTIFFTSHNLDEAERVATKVAIIDHGKIIMVGTPTEIKEKTGAESLEKAFLKLTGYDIRKEGESKNNMNKFKRRR